ncbi:MAG TPA: hypothetical protein VFO65_04315, partial [Acidimicrobiales bacterium]|nr:hypothetical protein [Acidimicrobiales bacterium]
MALSTVVVGGLAGVGVPPAGAVLGEIVEFTVGAAADRPEGIAHGADGNLWVAQRSGNRIDRVTPTGAVTKFALPTKSAAPSRIAAGPDGALWFTETAANKIGRITTAGAVTEYAVPTANSQPLGIAAGPDGAMWFVEQSASRIGRITMAGTVTEYRLTTGVAPAEITVGPDANLYFTERSGNRIGRVVPATGAISEFAPVPTAAGGLAGITTGPDGALWFTERNADKVGRITLDGAVTEYPVTVAGARRVSPLLLVAGPDDALWVTGFDAGAIVRVTTGGAVQSFRTPSSGSAPTGITVGPGFDLWFTENGNGKVGRIAPAFKPQSVTELTVSVEPAAVAAGHQRTPAGGVDPSRLTDTAALQAGLLRASPLASSPLASSPLASSPLASSPLASSPLASSPLASSALAPTLLSAIPLASNPLGSSGWADVLAGTRYAEVPLQTMTFADVLALAAQDPVVAQRLAALTLAHVPLASSPLASSSLAAVLLGTVPIGALPAPAGGWCAFLGSQPLDCTNGVVPTSTTLLDLEVAGDDLTAYYARQIDLSLATLSGAGYTAPLAFVRLANLNLAATPLGPLATALVPALVACPATGCAPTLASAQAAGQVRATATVADALAVPAVRDLHVGLGALIAGMVPPWQLPYEDGPLDAILDQALIRDFDLLLYTAAFDLSCAQPAGLEVSFAFPAGFRARPGTATLTVDGGPAAAVAEPTVTAGTHRYALATGGSAPPCAAGAGPAAAHRVGLSVQVEPAAVLGPYTATASASTALDRGTGQVATAGTALRTADDSHDTDDGGDPAAAQGIEADTLYAAHLSSPGDVDTYSLAAPAAGSLQVTLSHLPADYDLAVFGPDPGLVPGPDRSSPLASSPLASSPLGSSPLGSSPLGSSPLPDDSGQAGVGDGDLAPNTLQDIPLASSPLASSGLVARGISARRDRASESVTIPLTAADHGQRFVIQVSGFNTAWSVEPYILRAAGTPGAPPPPRSTAGRTPRPPTTSRPRSSGPSPPIGSARCASSWSR